MPFRNRDRLSLKSVIQQFEKLSAVIIGSFTAFATIAGTNDLTNDYTHDALHRLTCVDQIGQTGGNSVAEKRVDLGYNALGQFTSIARYKDTDGGTANEVASAAYSYNTLGRLTGLAYTKGSSNLFTPYSWTFDSLSSAGIEETTPASILAKWAKSR